MHVQCNRDNRRADDRDQEIAGERLGQHRRRNLAAHHLGQIKLHHVARHQRRNGEHGGGEQPAVTVQPPGFDGGVKMFEGFQLLRRRLPVQCRTPGLSHAPASVGALLFCLLAAFPSGAAAADGVQLKKQRALFLKVESALKSGRSQPFRRHRAALASYPLYPYLTYQDLRNRLAGADEKEIAAFLDVHGGKLPAAEKLRHRWLAQLARRGRWTRFLEHYRESVIMDNQDNRCRYAAALIHAGRESQAAERVKSLWLVDSSQPPACDFAFDWGFEQGVVDDDLIWKRAVLALGRGNRRLADYLGGKLEGDARRWFGSLKQARSRPERTALEMAERFTASPLYAGDVMAFSLRRLVGKDAVKAGETWDRIKRRCRACLDRRDVEKEIGVAAAVKLVPDEAYRRLSQLPREHHDQESRYWRVRAALRLEDWRRVLASVDALPGEERDAAQWSYWRARALAGLSRRGEANQIWNRLAQDDGYYGYLSADKLGEPYVYDLRPLVFTETELAALDAYPAVARMRELLDFDRPFDAHRELLLLLEDLDVAAKLKLGFTADRWQWPMGAIRSLASGAPERNFLQRFPMPYYDLVEKESRRGKIPMEWIYGIMRRESAFVKDIKSPAGALGLMQIRPIVVRAVGGRLGLRGLSTRQILSPRTNVRLGTAYIGQLHRRSDGNLAVSLAGYNAGPSNARRWLRTAPVSDVEIWVDTIPFEETRLYVRVVLFYTLLYRRLLDGPPTRLHELMGG